MPNEVDPALQKMRDLNPPRIYVQFEMDCNTVVEPRRLTLGPFLRVHIATDPVQLVVCDEFNVTGKVICLADWVGNGWQLRDSMEDSAVYKSVMLHTEAPQRDGRIIPPGQ